MEKHYTAERHTQILIALLKAHGVKKIVASPGTTNVCLVGSLQYDPYFEIYSSVDERSAAYIACGLARESGEPVALTCTGATASRNYMPGLTEAYYSNLPIVAITSTQHPGRIGQLMPQVLDRTTPLNDIVKKSVQINAAYSDEDLWAVNVAINDALLELTRHNGGPVHINLMSTYNPDFSVKELPKVRVIRRHFVGDKFPELSGKKVMIYVGTHKRWTSELVKSVDSFCEKYNAAVITEHISNYSGKYGVNAAILAFQEGNKYPQFDCDVMIHLGTVSGFGPAGVCNAKEVWRVHPDGEVRDTFRKLTHVFEMQENMFFDQYTNDIQEPSYINTIADELNDIKNSVIRKIPELPFSNAWIAQNTSKLLPENCELHLGILNSLRSWTMADIDREKNIEVYSNTGGYGIDGLVSTLIGSALVHPEKLYIGIVGDLAFFYDMNAIGNRHMPTNVRLMVVNNGRGTEFRNYNHPAERFGEDADKFMAAAGHYGKQSRDLIKNYATDLGFIYMTAENKEQYLNNVIEFLSFETMEKPIIFEVFTSSKDESDALKILFNLDVSPEASMKSAIKGMLGEKNVAALKGLLKK